MTTFDERERGFEAKFAHEQDQQVRLIARRDELFAEWAAKELKLSPEDGATLMHQVLQVPDGPDRDQRLKDYMMTRFPERPDFPLRTWLGANLASCSVDAHVQVIKELAFPGTA